MVQLRLIIGLVLLATLQTVDCSHNGLGALPRSRKISKAYERAYQALPPDTVYVPYRGNIFNLGLSAQTNILNTPDVTRTQCERDALRKGANAYLFSDVNDPLCHIMILSAPVCRVEEGNETNYVIMESFLTDGSPDDDPFPVLHAENSFMYILRSVDFRVMTPTILEFPELLTEMDTSTYPPGVGYSRMEAEGKTFLLPKFGGIWATDNSILVDPSCHTNSLCGVPVMGTPVEAAKIPHVALDQYCGQTIDLNDTPVLNVFSHAGIGCEFFPDVYPTPNCELTITSNSTITANVTLVNFRKPTCGGYELKFITSSCEVDMCQENTPAAFDSSEGKMQIKLTGSAPGNRRRYGFIIRLEKVPKSDNPSQCSSGNSVQGALMIFLKFLKLLLLHVSSTALF